jgi:hypothetical protein
LILGFAGVSAWARIRCTDECEPRGILDRECSACDRDLGVFEWLAERIEDCAWKLEHFVKK